MTALPSPDALRAYRDAVDGVRDLAGREPHVIELIHLGLAVREAGDDLVRPVPPVEANRLLMDRLRDGLSDWHRQAGQVLGEIEHLGANDLLFHTRGPAAVRILPDRAAVQSTIAGLQDAARCEVLVLDAGLDALQRSGPAGASTIHRRTIRTRAGCDREPSGEVRELATGPFSMVITDRTQAVVPLDVTGQCGGVLLRAPVLVEALGSHFDMLWERAVDVGARRAASTLPPATERVLRLLAAGFNDEEVADRMNVTSRTVGRHVQSILAATNSRTRFEACAKAFRNGWID